MKHFTPFRLATYLLLFFCAGHTAGGMLSQKSLGPASDAVFAQMKAVHFDFNGADSTWYDFWFGFGLCASIFLLLSAAVSWTLDRVPSSAWPATRPIAIALILAQAANTYLSFRYFFLGPALFGVLIVLLLALGTWRRSQGVA